MSHEIKATKQKNLVRQKNVTREIFFLKNHAENKAGRLVQNFFVF